MVTGVQVLFAFLLAVPFDGGFAHVGSFEWIVYFVTLLWVAIPLRRLRMLDGRRGRQSS